MNLNDSRGRPVVKQSPYNAETPAGAWTEIPTPTPLLYVRNHFDVPALDPATWRLRVGGAVETPLEWSLEDLRGLPHRTVTLTMECAGNGRSMLVPPAQGVQWGLGAVSTASYTGVPLRALLDRAGLRPDAVEIAFHGADHGEVEPGQVEHYARSLTPPLALDPDVLVAWEVNGAPLPPENGFPARLVVPRWYGMASVKWLAAVEARTTPFEGFYQREYRYVDEEGGPADAAVTAMRVRSLISEPRSGPVPLQPLEIRGIAWSGFGAVTEVEVSVDGGRSWTAAALEPPLSTYSATPWRLAWTPPHAGRFALLARATDAAGNRQPLEPVRNRRGYGNNAVQRVEIEVA